MKDWKFSLVVFWFLSEKKSDKRHLITINFMKIN